MLLQRSLLAVKPGPNLPSFVLNFLFVGSSQVVDKMNIEKGIRRCFSGGTQFLLGF